MRVLAVSGDANLITAITSMMRDWEIEHVREAKDAKVASEGATIALVATGSTEKGLTDAQVLWQLGITLPCLVIGDVPPPAGARVRVLMRPFTLQDLMDAVTEVEQGGAFSPYEDAEAEVVDVLPEAPDVEELPAAPPEPEPELEPPVVEEHPEEVPEPVAVEPEPKKVMVGHDPGHAEEPEPAPVAAAAPVVETPATPEPTPPAPAPQPVQQQRQAPIAAAAPMPITDSPKERRRFMRRRPEPQKGKEEKQEDPTVTRLKAAIHSARDLERLLSELPVLGQPRAMAHAFLGEVVEMFAPQVAAVYAPGVDGNYGVIAAHGLSSVEAGMKVQPSQALFMEIMTSCEAVLIAPVDLAQGLVAGIGGARTEALMVAPLEVSGMCHAIVIVGRQDFSEFDLDLLSELAEEAAPGLAVAQLLERLRSV